MCKKTEVNVEANVNIYYHHVCSSTSSMKEEKISFPFQIKDIVQVMMRGHPKCLKITVGEKSILVFVDGAITITSDKSSAEWEFRFTAPAYTLKKDMVYGDIMFSIENLVISYFDEKSSTWQNRIDPQAKLRRSEREKNIYAARFVIDFMNEYFSEDRT